MAGTKCGIYCIKNLDTGDFYIGSSCHIYRRWTGHRLQLRKNLHSNRHLQSAWNLYGEDVFTLEIIEECSREELLVKEQEYIDWFRPAYNLSQIAAGSTGEVPPMLGKKHSEETKAKIRESNRNNGYTPVGNKHPRSEATKEKMRISSIGNTNRLGTTTSDEGRENIRQAKMGNQLRKGTITSSEGIENIRNGQIGRKASEETKAKMSAARLGKKQGPRTEEAKQHMREAHLGKKLSQESIMKREETKRSNRLCTV